MTIIVGKPAIRRKRTGRARYPTLSNLYLWV